MEVTDKRRCGCAFGKRSMLCFRTRKAVLWKIYHAQFMWNCRFKWAHWGKAAQHRIRKMLSVWTKPDLQDPFFIPAHICSFSLSTKALLVFREWMLLCCSWAGRHMSLHCEYEAGMWRTLHFGFMVELELVRASKREERGSVWVRSLMKESDSHRK